MAITKIAKSQVDAVDLTTNQNVGGVKTFTADNLFLAGATGTQKTFGFSGADTNPNFKGVYDFDGGYSGFQSGTNKAVQVFGYWGVFIHGNVQNNTPNSEALITGTVTDPSLTVQQGQATAPIFELRNSAGVLVFRCDLNGALNLPLLTASTALALDASKNIVSVANTGTGNNVLGAGPTLSGLILAAGSTTVAPLKFTSGTNKTTAAAGEFEYNGTSLFFTPTGTTRQTIPYLGLAQTWTAQQSGTTPTAKDSTTKFATTAFVGKQFTATGSGTGSATSIVIAHGVSGVTTASSVIVTPNNAAAAGISYVTIDATNVTIVYTTAPANGTNNLAYSISIK